MSIICCPQCTQQVRVPDDRGQIKVRCPRCSTGWLYPAIIEDTSVAFSCAVTGVPFTVRFRRKPGRRFEIVGIHLNQPVCDAPRLMSSHRPAIVTAETADIADYDFTGFFCPSCHPKGGVGVTQGIPAGGFLLCGAGHLVCDGGVETIWDGRKKHTCFCGSSGILSTGSLASITANRIATPPEPRDQIPDGEPRLRIR